MYSAYTYHICAKPIGFLQRFDQIGNWLPLEIPLIGGEIGKLNGQVPNHTQEFQRINFAFLH